MLEIFFFHHKTSKINWCSMLFINNEAELKAYQITLRQALDLLLCTTKNGKIVQ